MNGLSTRIGLGLRSLALRPVHPLGRL